MRLVRDKMQDGGSNIKILGLNTNGKTLSTNRLSGNALNSDKPLILDKPQNTFQDDAIKDVSNKMENAVKQEQAGYFGQVWGTIKKPFETFDTSVSEFSKGNVAKGIGKLIETGLETVGAVISPISVGSEMIANMLPEDIKNLGMSKDVANTINYNLTQPFSSGAGALDIAFNKVLPETLLMSDPKTGQPFLASKKDIMNLGVPEDIVNAINQPIRSVGDLAVQIGLFKKLEGGLKTTEVKSPISGERLTELQGELKKENPIQSTNPKLLDQPKRFTSSEVGDSKIVPTPQEQLAISKSKLALTELNNKALELNNKAEILTEQLKNKKTKANKEAVKKVNEELEDINALRDAEQSQLDYFANDLKQRSLKGALEQDRGTFGSGVAPLGKGENAPSNVGFSLPKEKIIEVGNENKPLQGAPVKKSVHDYLVNRGLDLFKMVKADKPLDSGVLGDVLRQARDKGVYDEVLNTLKKEAFKRGKTLEFETALKNTVAKVDAEVVKPSELGEGIKISEIKDTTPVTSTVEQIKKAQEIVGKDTFEQVATEISKDKEPFLQGVFTEELANKIVDAGKLPDEYIKDVTPPKQSSRIISEELNKKADDILRENLGNVSANPLGNYKLYEALVIKGAYHLENGVIRFSQWSKKMIEENGEKIRPALMSIWNEVQKNAELKQTAVTNALPKVEKVNKLNTAIKVEANAPEAIPFQHTFKTLVESQALNTMGEYVKKQGEAGKSLVDAGNKVDRESSQLASKYITLYHNDIIPLDKFPNLKKEFIKIANEGGTSTNPLVNKALNSWKTIRTELGQKAIEQEMTMSYFDAKSKTFKEVPFAPIENFFPHKFDFNKMRSAKFKKQFVDNLASKLDVSRPEAERIWNQYIRRNTINEMKNIERVRQFNIDGWREELAVIPEYIQQASRRLKEVEIFGKDYQKANGLISQIDKIGGDFTSAQTLFDKWVGRDVYNRDIARYVSKLGSWQVLNKLGLLSLLNWTQGIANPAILFGIKAMSKSMLRIMRDYPELRKHIEPTGALDNSLAAYQLDSMSSAGMGDFMLRKTGVVTQERWNRVLSANAGMKYMEDQLASLIKNPNNKRLRNEMQRKIDMLNLTKEVNIDNALRNGKFTEKELLDVGYEGARKTQFLSRPQDLPNFMSNKDLKFFTLFKSFVLQQSTLVKDAVLKETFKGNIKPLLYMATIFPALGEIANTARAIVTGDKKSMDDSLLLHRQEWSKIIGRYALDLATIGSFGFAYDVTRASAYNPQGLIGWLAGANLGDLAEGTYAGLTAAISTASKTADKGTLTFGNFNPLVKFGARQIPIPVVKQQIGNALKKDSGSSGIGSRGGY